MPRPWGLAKVGASRPPAGLYTTPPDPHFLIDRHPTHANVTYASPCSGHGFKFAPVVGEVLADLALTGRTMPAADFLRGKRLGVNALHGAVSSPSPALGASR